MKCLKCDYENKEDAQVCNLCGNVFLIDKPFLSPSYKEESFHKPDEKYPLAPLLAGTFITGAFICFLTTKISLVYYTFVYALSIFFTHEIGHMVIAFLFGYFAFPAFTVGGGVTSRFTMICSNIWIPALIIGTIIYAIIKNKEEKGVVITGIITICVYCLFIFTPLKDLFIIAAGHIATAFIAGLFMIRGVFNKKSTEGFLSVSIGWFLAINEVAYFYKLLTNQFFRRGYIDGTLGTPVTGDLIKISQKLGIGFDLVIIFFIINAIILPFLVLGIRFYIFKAGIDKYLRKIVDQFHYFN
jgi:hypothetical protein